MTKVKLPSSEAILAIASPIGFNRGSLNVNI
jgi:hypothetical protein